MMECTLVLPFSAFGFSFGLGFAVGLPIAFTFAKHIRMTLLQRRLDREKKDAIERTEAARDHLDRAS
jgi:hypothetical protein